MNLTNTNFVVGAGGATITSAASLDFDGASSGIRGAGSGDVLTNYGGLLGSGAIGQGQMGLINNSQITSLDIGAPGGLTINTGAGENINNGSISADSTNGITEVSALVNNGLLNAELGTFTLQGAVSGTGSAQISGGTLYADATFNQAVTFTSTNGTLELAHGLTYSATISGFSRGGRTFLDLNDVGFVGTTEASFSGTATGGTLTVKDGTHTAELALSGNYLAAAFISASDGHGGVIVHIQAGGARPPPAGAIGSANAMISAMAAFAPGPGAIGMASTLTERPPQAVLLAPHSLAI